MNENLRISYPLSSDDELFDLQRAMNELLQTYRIDFCGHGIVTVQRMTDSESCKNCIKVVPSSGTSIKNIHLSQESEDNCFRRTGYTPKTRFSGLNKVREEIGDDTFIIYLRS